MITAKPLKSTLSPYGYYESVPGTYSSQVEYPLIIFLHGYGEIGNGTTDLPKILRTGLPMLLAKKAVPNASESFVILALQSKTTSIPAANIDAFITYALNAYSIDPTRIYITGLSGGAIAADAYIKTYDRAAAAVCIAGSSSGTNLSSTKVDKTPLWLFHGDADGTVPVTGSTNFYKGICTLTTLVEKPKITIYPGVNHNSWDRTYSLAGMGTGKKEHNFGTSYKADIRPCDTYTEDIYSWLLSHSKSL